MPYPRDSRGLLFVWTILISIMTLFMIFHVLILPYIINYCLLSILYDISHAPYCFVILVGPYGSFFLFASFQVHVKQRMRRVLVRYDLFGILVQSSLE